jgi:hypothetical protein
MKPVADLHDIKPPLYRCSIPALGERMAEVIEIGNRSPLETDRWTKTSRQL